MIPVVTVAQMKAIDEAASVPVDVLVERAGHCVFRAARQILGGLYGRRILVIAGPGNNGADGRVAARKLIAAGAKVHVVEPGSLVDAPKVDLFIDAAFGTGFRGDYSPPEVHETPVLAVDVPSGLGGDTGAGTLVCRATHTVTFAALKPGHLFGDGPELCGDIELCDIGLDVSNPEMALLEDSDVVRWLPRRARDAHKWDTAVLAVAGSAGMEGAASLACESAMRAGSGMVRLVTLASDAARLPREVVSSFVNEASFVSSALDSAERCKVALVGPGIGRAVNTQAAVVEILEQVDVPVLLDGDALQVLSGGAGKSIVRKRSAPTVITPHDGEFRSITGAVPGANRWEDAERLADELSATVLLKGPTTVVATPGKQTHLINKGGSFLATAGTGDVLAGLISSLVAQGLSAHEAAASGAFIHGASAASRYGDGLLAGDLPASIAEWIAEFR